MTIRSLIIDDEASNRQNLGHLLHKYCPQVEIVGEAENAAAGIDLIQQTLPNLLFLDIRMPGGDAFDMLESLETIDFEIIFITAYDEYAFRAFAFNALDYLLKPVNFKLLVAAVEKVQNKLQVQKENLLLKNLVSNLQLENGEKRIALSMEDKTEFIVVKDIIRCQADSNYTRFFLVGNRSILVSKTLKDYEIALENSNFIRVHNSHLVNRAQIQAFSKRDGGYLEMSDGSQVPISRNRKEEVNKRLIP